MRLQDCPKATKNQTEYIVTLVTKDTEHSFEIRTELDSTNYEPYIKEFAKTHNITDYKVKSVQWLGDLLIGQYDIGMSEYTTRKIA